MISVLAGVNGAGKSSIGGAAIRAAGQDWYNPDELARAMQTQFPERSLQQINSAVWHEGRLRLEQAIRAHAEAVARRLRRDRSGSSWFSPSV